MAKTEKRVLRFFVSGALLAGSAACSKNKSETEETTESVNEGPVNQEELEHVNEGPVEKPVDQDTHEKHVNEGPATVPVKEPDRVNTNHIGPNGENLNPMGAPGPLPTPDETNTNRQKLPVGPPAGPPSAKHRTNTNRQRVPKPKAPRAPDRTNTNRELVAPKTPITPVKP